ncbi:MAG: aminoglycoside phosphotransferase family protein [Methylovulum sp.]|nr:aminoglycoside phosphotransferase family protein [Methylovulum sp.]
MPHTILVHRPSDLTVAWAQRIVHQHDANAVVSNVNIVSVDIGTTTRVRVTVEHDSTAILSKRWFVKLPSLAWRARLITALPRLLHTEVRFYQEIAQSIPIFAPFCLAAYSRIGWGSTLVLTDITEFDGIPGFPCDTLTVDQAAAVIVQLGRFHAHFWNSANLPLTYPWLAGSVRRLEDALGTALAVPLMKQGLHLANKILPATLHNKALHYARHRSKAMRFLADAPPTLTHHDCHPGNLFWQQSQAGFLDWQLVRMGDGISDVAYFLATALLPETRRLHETELLEMYQQTLAENGVDLGSNDLMQRYRAHLVYPLEAMVVTLAVGGMMHLDSNLELIRRAAAAVEDLDAFSALPI